MHPEYARQLGVKPHSGSRTRRTGYGHLSDQSRPPFNQVYNSPEVRDGLVLVFTLDTRQNG